jgi:DNA polymerase I-like protein with 3'-5' exonuclease and polymerase domains
LNSLLIMQVHDELVFDVFPWEEDTLSQNLQKIMENILIEQQIVLKSDVLIWDTWKETK